jgi:hypothetical protein
MLDRQRRDKVLAVFVEELKRAGEAIQPPQ